jgi:hypothetical protein
MSVFQSLNIYWIFGSRVHPASYPIVTRGSFLGVKLPEREAEHSLSPSAEVKNAWTYTSSQPYMFMAWYLVKHRDAFTTHMCVCFDKRDKIKEDVLIEEPPHVQRYGKAM